LKVKRYHISHVYTDDVAYCSLSTSAYV
jgi:hypothetical protein